MEIHYSFEKFGKIKNPVVTTGTFDGVHVGHKTIINRLNKLAENIEGESVLITFHPHPRKVLFPEKQKDLKLINTQREKKRLLSDTGLDHLFIINFTLDFSKTTSQFFVNNILIEKLKSKIIVVGFNHHFGHNREGNYDYLYKLSKKHDFSVEEIPQQDIENEAVSSTRIRKALTLGNIQRANAYLDSVFMMSGETTNHHDEAPETGLNFLKLQIEEDVKIIPPEGIYAISISSDKGNHRGMAIIDSKENILINLIEDDDFNPEQRLVFVKFHKRIRLEKLSLDNKQAKKKIEKGKKEIMDLIY